MVAPGVARADGCVDATTGFDCDFAARLARVQKYVESRPGYTGVAVSDGWRDRVWRNEYADRPIYAASTAKLAIALDILMRRHRGEVQLSTDDWRWLYAALVSSDNGAANHLWNRYGGASMVDRWKDYGMTETGFVPGLERHWGSMKTTAADLRRLVRYVVRETPSEVRRYLMARMRGVADNQQWGVWSAGSGWVRGNKNGWFRYRAGWVLNSVGWVGAHQRYLVAVMADQRSRGTYASGVETTSEVARILFA
ncbi:serine hydrolase [Cryptosporangium phraense]|uniref:serine hydrolase n=1 Tax=Cryptosporangium phraense TaxID=2593070 RepID=UPI0014782753|nr:serine hydrolase [Cryptosporangium phraense]